MSSDLAESKGVSNPLTLLEAAINKGINPDQLGKLMDLQERWERNRAAEAFAEAIGAFQAECPPIFKSRTTAPGGKLNFAYASYDDVLRVAGPLLTKNRIIVTFDTAVADLGVSVTCRVRVGIHCETTTLAVPVPAGIVNNTQLFGQAVAYAKRYSFCAALNIVTTDEDNDAANMMQFVDATEIAQINDAIEACEDAGRKVNFKLFLRWLGIESLENLPKKDLAKALHELARKLKEPQK